MESDIEMRIKVALSKVFSTLAKDYKILKLIFIITASFLIYNVFFDFLIVKPTYRSDGKRNIGLEDFPEITICPKEPINLSAANINGYHDFETYFTGYYDGNDSITFSWAGNKSENIHTVSSELSNLQSIENCYLPTAYGENNIWYENNNTYNDEPLEFIPIKVLYPNHLCCKVVPPALSEHSPIAEMQFASSGSFKIFLADKTTYSYFDQNKDIMLGHNLVSGPKHKGQFTYKVNIMEEERLESDTENPCINYKTNGEYAECIEDEMVRQNSYYLNCTPPWMTKKEELWCKGRHEIDENMGMKYYTQLIGKIVASEASTGKCFEPCKIKRYQVKKIGSKQRRDDLRGLTIYFGNKVKTTKSKLTITTRTLFSKIGGFIGVNRSFLWLIIMFLSTVGTLVSKLKLYNSKHRKEDIQYCSPQN